MAKYPTKCQYCGGPMPPPALTGRPRSFCSAACRSAAERYRVSQQYIEKQRREQEDADRAAARRQAAADKKQLKERERILKAGGYDAGMLLWEMAYNESLDKGGPGLCQWQDEDTEGTQGPEHPYLPRQCFRPQEEDWDVYCRHHNQVLNAEQAQRKGEQPPPPPPEPPEEPGPWTPLVVG
jgi:hypothetical protein